MYIRYVFVNFLIDKNWFENNQPWRVWRLRRDNIRISVLILPTCQASHVCSLFFSSPLFLPICKSVFFLLLFIRTRMLKLWKCHKNFPKNAFTMYNFQIIPLKHFKNKVVRVLKKTSLKLLKMLKLFIYFSN